MMLSKNKQSIHSGDGSFNLQVLGDLNLLNGDYPTAIVDQVINDGVDNLRKSRFFVEFDRVGPVCILGRRLVDADLSRGTDVVRAKALAWCTRLLSRTKELTKAKEYLALAKSLGNCQEITISEAFLASEAGDKAAALSTLAAIGSPASHSAAFMVVTHHEGGAVALDWLKNAGHKVTDLDSDGKVSVLIHQLDLGQWDAVSESIETISDQDLIDAPILYHIWGMTLLLRTVPTEFRSLVLRQLPIDMARFELFSDSNSLESRRTAQKHFADAAMAAQRLNCLKSATIDDEYSLWLELKDPDNADKGRLRLKEKLRDSSALRLVPFGLQFGIDLDLEAVKREIERQIVLNGRITPDAAIARFSLAFMQKTPADVANYIDQHFTELSNHYEKKFLLSLQVESLSRAGLPRRASECLSLLLSEGLSDEDEKRIKTIISESEGVDPIEARKAHFEQSDKLADLLPLVDDLESRKDWDDLCKYGEILFDRTRSVRNAERFANALTNTNKFDRLVSFLSNNADLRSQSKHLQMFYSWALFYEGAYAESRTELANLGSDRVDPNYRALEMNLGIAIGDWSTLNTIVANEYKDREKRSAQELIRSAQLAIQLKSPYAKDLIFAAADKASDDASVFASAYFLATSAGLDDNPEPIRWLHRAAELSGEDGPIQRMSLKDILDRKPDWDRRESETWQSFSRGELPIFLAAQSLNKSLVDFTLFPALANQDERDPRRRSLIPAYSGNRQPVMFNFSGKAIGLEVTALLTLSFLGLLEKTLDAFDLVYLTHSTLAWLFEEKQKAIFHQPSRIKNAHHLRDLLARGLLEKFVPSTVVDSDLAQEVGDGLASLIVEAKKVIENDSTQRLVIRSSPVHRIATLMEEEANLEEYASVMSSCLSIVKKLREKGQITAKDEQSACAYLLLQERPWPNQPEISDGAILYLDDLAITYFQHLGLLEKLHAGGFHAIASSSEVAEANAFINYERIAEKVIDSIEGIRAVVNLGVESGKVKFGKQGSNGDSDTLAITEHPTVAAFGLASACDVLVSDDRFLNRHSHFDDGNIRAEILSTLDLLDAFATNGTISVEELMEFRTSLRRAGFVFVSVKEDELAQCLNSSIVKDDILCETYELKAIRENILRVRMSDWLQLPKEAPWLDSTLKACINVLRSLWVEGANIADVTVRSNWIVSQVDVRGWAHSIGEENRDYFVKVGRGAHLLLFLSPLIGVSENVKNAYWSWVEESILEPIKEQFPELYEWIVGVHKEQIDQIIEAKLLGQA